MAILTLAWPDGDRWTMDVQLDGEVYTISAAWNDRMETWTMDLDTGDGERLLTGVRVIKDWPLLPPWRDERFPPGNIYAVAPSGRIRRDPGRDAFRDDGPSFRLVYIEAENATV